MTLHGLFLTLALLISVASAQIPYWASNCPTTTAGTCGCQSSTPSCWPSGSTYQCTLPTGVLDSVKALFPEGSTPDPSLLGNLGDIKIYFPQSSMVNFTFVTEGAGYRNQFGYFMYNQTNPSLPGFVESSTVVFPDVSFPSTGCLSSGLTVSRGPVSAGLWMGFWVVADGYNGGTSKWVSFQDGASLKNSDGKNHTGWVYLSDLNTTLFGFEDLNGLGDKDYNDVMFTIATDAIIDLSRVPRYQGGLIQQCRQGVIAQQDYLEYKCQQWALLSPPSGATCNSFLSVPTGWTLAYNDTDTLDMIANAGNTFTRTLGSTGCIVTTVSLGPVVSTAYTTSGAACTASMTPFTAASSSCFAVPCSSRILIKGRRISSCTGSDFQYCRPNVAMSVISQSPSSIPQLGDAQYASTAVYPSTYNLYTTPGGSINLNISTIIKSARNFQGGVATDIYFLLDTYNAYGKDLEYLSSNLVNFANSITDTATIDFDIPNIGFGTFKSVNSGGVSFSNSCPLNPDVVTIADCINKLGTNGWSTGSSSQKAFQAVDLAISNLAGQFRSFAYKLIVVISDNAQSSYSALANTEIQYNTVPIFYNPNPSTNNLNTYVGPIANLPLSGRRTGTLKSDKDMGDKRLQNWHIHVPTFLKSVVLNITQARMPTTTSANIFANGFIGALAPPLNVYSGGGSQFGVFDRPVTITFPSTRTVADLGSQPLRTVVTTLGFGTTEFNLFANRPPVAIDTPVSTDEDTPVKFEIAPTDVDGNRMRIAFLSNDNPSAGALSTDVEPSAPVDFTGATYYENFKFRFVPATNWNGEVRFGYVVNDGCQNSSVRAVILTVRPVNDPPTAANFSVTSQMNDAVLTNFGTANFVGKINDIDNDVATLSITIVTVPPTVLGFLYDGTTRINSGGYVLGTGRTLTFVPNAYQAGIAQFQYRVSDGSLTADAFVTVTVIERRFSPVLSVAPSTLTSGAGNTTQFIITVFDADSYRSSETTTLELVGNSLTAGNTITLLFGLNPVISASTTTLPATWVSGVSVPSATATMTFNAEWLAATSPDGQNITLRARDSFSNLSNEVVVKFIVSGNRPPFIMYHPATVTTLEDTPVTEITLSGTDLDGVGNPNQAIQEWRDLMIQFTSLPSSGSLNLVRRPSPAVDTPIALDIEYQIGNGSLNVPLLLSQYNVTYTPNADFNGQDSFTYVFIDRHNGISSPNTTVITVTPVNDRPTTSDLTLQMNEFNDPNVAIITTIDEFSAFDTDDDPLTLELTSLPAKGVLKFGGVPVTSASPAVPFNVGTAWSFTYEPPYMEYSIPDGSVFASFNFRVCDNSGAANNCSLDATVSLIVNFVNSLPTSDDITVRTPSNTPVSFDIIIADLDVLRDPDTVRYAVFTAAGAGNKGTFYLCAAMDSTCVVTPDTFNQPIKYPRRIWYMPGLDDFSTNGPSAIMKFQVGDNTTLNTGITYTISVFVDFVNQPPEWRAESVYTIDEDTSLTLFTLASNSWYDDLLRVPENQANPPPFPVVTFKITSLPSRGVLSLCRAGNANVSSSCNPVTQADLPATSDDSLGRILFTPEKDCWGQNYTSFVIQLTDSGFPYGPKMSTDVTIYIHVASVNDPPIFEAIDFHTIDSNMNGPVINEDSQTYLTWRLHDVDTAPQQLLTKIKTSSFSRGGWMVKRCIDDGFAGFELCPAPAQVFQTNKTELFSVELLRYESVTCNTVEGLPTTDFSGCWAEFKVVFIPEPGRFQIPYTQWTFNGFDGEDTGKPGQTLISVLPVNDPPTITAPARVVGTAGTAEMPIKDDSGVVIVVADSDANPRSTVEKFKIEILEGDGDFIPAEKLVCEWVQTTVPTWECYNNLNNLNKYLALSKFKIDTNFGEEALVRWTIDDLGNTSPEGAAVPLNASTTTRFVFTKLPAIIPNTPGNYLSLTAIIGALGGLLLIALVAWRLKKSLAAPDDTYFEMGVTSISAAPTSPLYKAQFKEAFNPVYKPTDV